MAGVPRKSNPSLCLGLPLPHPVFLFVPCHSVLSEQPEMRLWSFPGAGGQRWRGWSTLVVSGSAALPSSAQWPREGDAAGAERDPAAGVQGLDGHCLHRWVPAPENHFLFPALQKTGRQKLWRDCGTVSDGRLASCVPPRHCFLLEHLR